MPLIPFPPIYPPLLFGDSRGLSAGPSLCFVQRHVQQPSLANWLLSQLSSSPPAANSPRFSQEGSISACVSLPLSLPVSLQGRDFSNTQERSQNFQLGFSRCVLCPLQSDLSGFQLTVTLDFHPQKGLWMQMSCGCPWIGEMALWSLEIFAPKKHLGEI